MAKRNNAQKTWRYSMEFKAMAVHMSLQDGVQVQQVAAALDIHPFMLSRWRKEYREGKIVADKRKRPVEQNVPCGKELIEVEKLRKENAKLKQENELLKKATVSGGTTSQRFGFIAVHGKTLGVRYLCHWLNVSRSGYYAWSKRKESMRASQDLQLLEQIKTVHARSNGIYGSPRVHRALAREGVAVGKKRVERLMRIAGLSGRVARMYRRLPGLTRFYEKHQNLKLGMAAPTGMNQQWVGDLTYIKVANQWRYLAVVMDLYSRRVIGWSLGEQKTAELTLRALRQAIRQREPGSGLIFHTDRGVEYGAHLIQTELVRYGIRSSMNRPGRCTDNAHMESFFHSLKAEALHGCYFRTEDELRVKLNHYISHFYNHRRLHSGIGYKTLVEHEEMVV
ncbi:IS3 family transposase [Crenobacter cavernae]|uniref:IS3 family transposase n=1 Tax=Crenobacter cavernae TaxID=2290923 RepID=UPI003D331B76